MDYLNANIKFYVTSRHTLNEQCAKIFQECKALFRDKAPQSSRAIINWLESSNKNQLVRHQLVKNEPMDYLEQTIKVEPLCLEDRTRMRTVKFDFNKMFECKQIPEKIAFYSLCRYQINANIDQIIKDLNVLFKNNVPTLDDLESLISNCFGVVITKQVQPVQLAIQEPIKIIKSEPENPRHNPVIIKMERIEIEENQQIGIKAQPIEETLQLQNIIEEADLKYIKLTKTIEALKKEKSNLNKNLLEVTTEFKEYKTQENREKLKNIHIIKFLKDKNKIESEKNRELNEKLSEFGTEISETVNKLTKLHDELNLLKEENSKLISLKEDLQIEITTMESSLHHQRELNNVQREKLISATSYIKCQQKEIDVAKKENDELKIQNFKLNNTRSDYLKFLNESGQSAKALQEKNDEIKHLKESIDTFRTKTNDAEVKLNFLQNEIDYKTKFWQAKTIEFNQMNMEASNLKSINADLEIRLSYFNQNQYGNNSAYFNRNDYFNNQNGGRNRLSLGGQIAFKDRASKRRFTQNEQAREQEKTRKITKLMDIPIEKENKNESFEESDGILVIEMEDSEATIEEDSMTTHSEPK